MGNDTSSPSKGKGGDRSSSGSNPVPRSCSVLVVGSPGVGKRSLWRQILTGTSDFSVAYDESAISGADSIHTQTDAFGDVALETVFASCENATSTIHTARFKQTRVFILVYDLCDRESFLNVTATGSQFDVLYAILGYVKDHPSRKQKVFLVGNKCDAYQDAEVWDATSQDDEGVAEALARLSKWKAASRTALNKQSRKCLAKRLSPIERQREVSKEDAKGVVRFVSHTQVCSLSFWGHHETMFALM